jgi:hypothetical protein
MSNDRFEFGLLVAGFAVLVGMLGAVGPASAAGSTHIPARFTDATFTPTCTSGSGEFPCEPGQVYQGRIIAVQESCDGVLSSLPGGITPSGLRDPGMYSGAVDGDNVFLRDKSGGGQYDLYADLSPNNPSFTGTWEVIQEPGEAPIDNTGEYSVTGSRSTSAPPWPGCNKSAPAKKCKKHHKLKHGKCVKGRKNKH